MRQRSDSYRLPTRPPEPALPSREVGRAEGGGQGLWPRLGRPSGPPGDGDAPSFRCRALAAGAPAGIPGMRQRGSGLVGGGLDPSARGFPSFQPLDAAAGKAGTAAAKPRPATRLSRRPLAVAARAGSHASAGGLLDPFPPLF